MTQERYKGPFVFVSYSHVDAKFASDFASRLREAGIDYFLDDESINWGEPIPAKIHDALNQATHVVVLLSPGSEKSQWVAYETGYASGRNLVLVPYLLHQSMSLPGFLASRRYLHGIKDEQRFIQGLKAFKSNLQPAQLPSKFPKKRPILSLRDVSSIEFRCGPRFVDATILLREFSDDELVEKDSVARMCSNLWKPIFRLIALMGGYETSQITTGRPIAHTENHEYVRVTRGAKAFRPAYDEWGSVDAEISLRDLHFPDGFDWGYLDFYLIPHVGEDQLGFNPPAKDEVIEIRIKELEPHIKDVLKQIVDIALSDMNISIDWKLFSWSDNCTIWGGNAYWLRGVTKRLKANETAS